VTYFNVLYQQLPIGTEKNHESAKREFLANRQRSWPREPTSPQAESDI